MENEAPTIRIKAIDEKFCGECGSVIKAKAEICPHCGVRQMHAMSPLGAAQESRNKTTAAILAIFLGGLGAHRFYLGMPWISLVYLVFCWTFIPSIIALIEGIIFLSMSDAKFSSKYPPFK